jgi:hypothetical protein
VEARESVMNAVVADAVVVGVHMDGRSVADAVVIDAFVVGRSIMDEASCVDVFSDAVGGSMVMQRKAPDKEHVMQQGQSLWKGIPDPGGVKQYVMQQECVTEQRQSL